MKTPISTHDNGSRTCALAGPVPGRKPVLALLVRLLCAAMLLLPAFGASASVVFTGLHSFQGFATGRNPSGRLVQGSDGNFYGTTYGGGTNGNGTVFKISASGVLTTLYSFTGGLDGSWSQAGLVQGRDGNFYGTTGNGGTNGAGTVFKISATGVLTTLYSFTGGTSGEYWNFRPNGGLVQGRDGNFYGTTTAAAPGEKGANFGTVFKISATGVLTTLYSFTGGNDGRFPSGLVQGSDGNFYGTTGGGGAFTNQYGQGQYGEGDGTVFKISATGVLTSLYSFTGGTDGANPSGPLVQGSDGDFYGTTYGGGNTNVNSGFGYGTVFKISATGLLTSLYSFTVYSFTGGNNGASPNALVQGSDGNFYGTTDAGGTNGFGTVFKISTAGVLTSLYSFTGGKDGSWPSGLVEGRDGNFYGTTASGGPNNPEGRGTVFGISPSGALATLHTFTGGMDGGDPLAGLVQGSDGNFYGTTAYGGPNYDGWGTAFKIRPSGVLTTLHAFTGGKDGASPQAGLVQGSDGNFYGATKSGGETNQNGGWGNGYGYGTVFKVTTYGALSSLYSFTGGKDGEFPQAGLLQGSDGNFYGTTTSGGTNGSHGTVFKISASGVLTSLYSFTGGNDGAGPSGLVQGSDGNFYGTTSGGGTNGDHGTVFKISTVGVLTSLYSFTGGKDGGFPQAGLVQGSDGNFYGTTSGGGTGGAGTVFRLTAVQAAPAFLAATLTNGTLSLTWSTEAGGMYQLQYNSDLSSTTWTNLGGPATAAGTTLHATDSVTNGPRRFYRVVLLP